MSDADHKISQLCGQFAALEHLVLALLAEHLNKRQGQASFLKRTARNATLDLYSMQPEAFLEGFSARQKMLVDILEAYFSNQNGLLD
jgi:hypothetical protein